MIPSGPIVNRYIPWFILKHLFQLKAIFQENFIVSKSSALQLFPWSGRPDLYPRLVLRGPRSAPEAGRLEVVLPTEFKTRSAPGFEPEMLGNLEGGSVYLQSPSGSP